MRLGGTLAAIAALAFVVPAGAQAAHETARHPAKHHASKQKARRCRKGYEAETKRVKIRRHGRAIRVKKRVCVRKPKAKPRPPTNPTARTPQGTVSPPVVAPAQPPTGPPAGLLNASKAPSKSEDSPGLQSGTAWENSADLGEDAQPPASVETATNSEALATSDYGFSLPPAAVVTGIEVIAEAEVLTFDGIPKGVSDLTVKTLRAGVASASAETKSAEGVTTLTFGSATSLWGQTWTPEQIDETGFGAMFVVSEVQGGWPFSLLGVRISVYYTLGETELAAGAVA